MIGGRKFLVLSMAVLLADSVGASPQDDPRFRIRTTVELVVVPVTAKDSEGKLVHDIRREEFRVFDDGVEQELAVFSADAFPLSVVVLIDNDLPLKAAEHVQRSAAAMAAGFSEADEVAIGLYDTIYQPLLGFTADNDKIYDQLKRLELASRFPGQGSGPMTAGPRVNMSPIEPKVPSKIYPGGRGRKNLFDAVYAAGELLRNRGRERRKIILLVSDGGNSRNNTASYEDTLRLLLSADISVYAIGAGDAVLNRAPSVLTRYARATGGDVFYATSRADLEALYARITEQARNQYTLAYVPRNIDRTREYHSIEVRVRRANLSLLARDGYFALAIP